MALQTNSVDGFTKKVMCLFIHGCAIGIGLELLNKAHLISDLSKSATRCGIWAILTVYFVYQLHATFQSRAVLTTGIIFAFVSTLILAFSVCEDVRSFDSIPLIGRHSSLHSLSIKICLCIWAGSITWMFLALIRSTEKAQTNASELRAELAHRSRVTALGEMAAGIGHELNQPLAAISNFAAAGQMQLNRDANTQEKVSELLAEIEQQAKRAGHIIRMLKNMSQPTSESRKEININDLVKNIADLMKPDLRKNVVTTQLNLTRENPVTLVDEVQIQQVLMNLIRNAVDAMANETGSRDLSITTEMINDNVAITVTDSGPGISAEVGEELFDPFYTTKPNGTGIGLSIGRSIIEAHGGTIRLLSNDSKGASFHLTLPLVRVHSPEPHFHKSLEVSRKT